MDIFFNSVKKRRTKNLVYNSFFFAGFNVVGGDFAVVDGALTLHHVYFNKNNTIWLNKR